MLLVDLILQQILHQCVPPLLQVCCLQSSCVASCLVICKELRAIYITQTLPLSLLVVLMYVQFVHVNNFQSLKHVALSGKQEMLMTAQGWDA